MDAAGKTDKNELAISIKELLYHICAVLDKPLVVFFEEADCPERRHTDHLPAAVKRRLYQSKAGAVYAFTIGEALKQIDKLTDAKLLAKYPEIDWQKAKGMRDIITHHYFDIDAETVFTVGAERLPVMKEAIVRIAHDLQK